MMRMTKLSNAQSLRVIGQELAELGVSAFNLARRDDEYTVWIDNKQTPREATRDKSAGEKSRKKLFGNEPSTARSVSDSLHFAEAQILWADVARQFNRKDSQEIADLNELSLLLRALGSFLDKNEADDFIVFWSSQWIKVVFDNREENFSALDLYNIGTHMYLKRSSRRFAD